VNTTISQKRDAQGADGNGSKGDGGGICCGEGRGGGGGGDDDGNDDGVDSCGDIGGGCSNCKSGSNARAAAVAQW
jgi:hypothetical protein